MDDLYDWFAAVYCINLDRRPERWTRFQSNLPADWPFAQPERYPAIDGKYVQAPKWWKQGPGAWGCFRSHLSIIENSMSRRQESVLIFEDDAVFPPDFSSRASSFLHQVPNNWEMIYFGGQHLKTEIKKPTPVNKEVVVPFNVNRMHAYSLRGKMLEKVYHHLNNNSWQDGFHIDHMMGQIHEKRIYKIYCPMTWLVGQASGNSDIEGKTFPVRFWN